MHCPVALGLQYALHNSIFLFALLVIHLYLGVPIIYPSSADPLEATTLQWDTQCPYLGVPIIYPSSADPLEATTLRWDTQCVSVIPETISTGRQHGAFPFPHSPTVD